LKTVDLLMCIWDCGNFHNLINDYAGQGEGKDYQEHYADPDICGWGYLLPLLCDRLSCLVYLLYICQTYRLHISFYM
jgi:hypothetical protein